MQLIQSFQGAIRDILKLHRLHAVDCRSKYTRTNFVTGVAARIAGNTPTPQAAPLPVWAAILVSGFLFFMRRT
jgi:ubiquinone biosynthesis protein COQ9